jgi:uncharacterized protein YjbI with pentapeptide repeats
MDPHTSSNVNLKEILEGVDLSHARLEGADLKHANLEGKDLSNANLTRADLFSANLRGANLHSANFYQAFFFGTNLQGAHHWAADGLTQEQIDRAIGDENTVLPRNLHAPQHWSKGANE